MFDALHDMGDPEGATARVRSRLASDGTFLVVEPMAGGRLEDNVNPIGWLFYSAGLFICVAHAKSQAASGSSAPKVPEQTWRELLASAGFTSFRRAAETPFNRVSEARPDAWPGRPSAACGRGGHDETAPPTDPTDQEPPADERGVRTRRAAPSLPKM